MDAVKLFRTKSRTILSHEDKFYELPVPWDELINRDQLFAFLIQEIKKSTPTRVTASAIDKEPLPPVGSQEVWAAGVTYFRSKEARMDESKDSGGASFYDKVYAAERPELFFKSAPHRVVGSHDVLFIRKDSNWNVPEPELTLFINSRGRIEGYTAGNDMSSRSIEGENPLYLPQAKTYSRSAALGPCLYVPATPISLTTTITMEISRSRKIVYQDQVQITQMKRKLTDLAQWLFRECDFPFGCFLMTGTCLVPSSDFTLAVGDVVTITIDQIGTLINTIGMRQ